MAEETTDQPSVGAVIHNQALAMPVIADQKAGAAACEAIMPLLGLHCFKIVLGYPVVSYVVGVLPPAIRRTISVTRTGRGKQIAAPFTRLGLVDFRSEEHTSELQSLMRISYAVFCLKKQKT